MGTEDFFDKTIFFQDSCEQDYEREIWEGIPAFEKIYDNAMKISDKKLTSLTNFPNYFDEETDWDYERRVYAYDQIWKELEDKVFEDKSTLYLSVFTDLYSYSTLEPFINILSDKLRKIVK